MVAPMFFPISSGAAPGLGSPLKSPVTGITNTDSNYRAASTTTGERGVASNATFVTGKKYYEFLLTTAPGNSGGDIRFGLIEQSENLLDDWATHIAQLARTNVSVSVAAGDAGGGTLPTGVYPLPAGIVLGVAADNDAKKAWVHLNGDFGNGDPAEGTNPHFASWSGTRTWRFYLRLPFSGDACLVPRGGAIYPIPDGFEFLKAA